MGLAGATVADGDDVLPSLDVFTRASSMTRALFTDGMARKSKVSRLLTAGKRAARIRRYHALVAVNEFQFSEAQQVVGMGHSLGRRTGRPACGTP